MRRFIAIACLMLAAVAGYLLFARAEGRPPIRPEEPISSVVVAAAATGNIPIILTGLGTVASLQAVTVKSQISGYLQALPFQEGQIVQKGDVIAQIDSRPYEALLAQYEGTLRKDQALLKDAELILSRYQKLNTQDSIAKQNVDTQAATVQQYEGTIAADQAQVDAQKLNIAYCRITSPVTGRIGLRQIDVGNYVQSSDSTGIVIVVQMQPISVLFTLPEDDLARIAKQLKTNIKMEVEAYDAADRTKLATGWLDTFDNQIDTATGTIKFRALFENADETLFPNQFVNIHLKLDNLTDVVTVPTAAIQHGTPGTYVYKLDDASKVAVTKIVPGESSGDKTAVLSGLKPGDWIVVDGIDRLYDGAKVNSVSDSQTNSRSEAALLPTGNK